MTILNLNTDVLPYLQRAADDSYGNVARVHNAVEAYVKNYCNRNFESASYKEIIPDFRGGKINLKNYPVTEISRIAVDTLDVIRIYNTNTYTSATVKVTSTGITLTYNGTASTVAFATYTTLAAVVTQINTIGSGWTAELVSSDYGSIVSTELILNYGQSAIDRQDVYLSMLGSDIAYEMEYADSGIIDTGIVYLSELVFGNTQNKINLYVNYTAGYSTLPNDLKQAMLSMIAMQYSKVTNSAFGIKSFRIADYSITYGGSSSSSDDYLSEAIPAETRAMLDSYKYFAF